MHNQVELLEMRIKQIKMRNENIKKSKLKKERSRKKGQEYFDAYYQIRKELIRERDFVLAYDVKLINQDKSKNTKLLYRQLGPYRVYQADQLKGSYLLKEVNGTPIRRLYAGNRLKKFVKRNRYQNSLNDNKSNEAIELIAFNDKEDTDVKEEAAKEQQDKENT